MSKQVRYQTRQVRTSAFAGKSKVRRLVAKGWEVVSVTAYGWHGSLVTLRREK